jgi:hypothetical protein
MSGQVTDGFKGVLRAETRDDEAAKNLREVVRGFVALARLQAGANTPLQAMMQSLEIGGDQRTVALTFSVPAGVVDSFGNLATPRKPQPAH